MALVPRQSAAFNSATQHVMLGKFGGKRGTECAIGEEFWRHFFLSRYQRVEIESAFVAFSVTRLCPWAMTDRIAFLMKINLWETFNILHFIGFYILKRFTYINIDQCKRFLGNKAKINFVIANYSNCICFHELVFMDISLAKYP